MDTLLKNVSQVRTTTAVETNSTNNPSNKTVSVVRLEAKEVNISSNQQQLPQHITVKVVQAPVDLKVAIMAPVAVVMSVVRACHLLHLSTTMVIRSQAQEEWVVCRTMVAIKEVDLGQTRVLLEGLVPFHLTSSHLCMEGIHHLTNIRCMAWAHQTTVIQMRPLGWVCLHLNSKLKVVELSLEPMVHQHIRHLIPLEPRQTILLALNLSLKEVEVVHNSNISRCHSAIAAQQDQESILLHQLTCMADKFPKHRTYLLEMDLTRTNNSNPKSICINSSRRLLG